MNELFSTQPAGFAWATGIESTFIPQIRAGLRRLDEYELTQHYEQWKSDFDLLAECGVRAVRWAIPWYRVQPRPNEWDWRWVDEALDYLVNVKGIVPIIDLMHYGTPLWMENSFINSGYPGRVATYAGAVAERYKSLVRYYTPLNEPMVNAEWSGHRGRWPPYLEGNDGYVKVAMAVAKGIVLTVQALKAAQPDMVTIQVEALWKFKSSNPDIAAQVRQQNERQYLSWDLTTGRVDEAHLLYGFLQAHGQSEQELSWFRENAVSFDILGANFYPWSYGRVSLRKEGFYNRMTPDVSGLAIGEVLADAWERYRIPLMVTETSARRGVDGRALWMDETIAAVRRLRQQGVPVVGYTWYPFFTMFSWYYRRGRRDLLDYILHLGIYEADFDEAGIFRRRATPLVERYRRHMAQPMPPVMLTVRDEKRVSG